MQVQDEIAIDAAHDRYSKRFMPDGMIAAMGGMVGIVGLILAEDLACATLALICAFVNVGVAGLANAHYAQAKPPFQPAKPYSQIVFAYIVAWNLGITGLLLFKGLVWQALVNALLYMACLSVLHYISRQHSRYLTQH